MNQQVFPNDRTPTFYVSQALTPTGTGSIDGNFRNVNFSGLLLCSAAPPAFTIGAAAGVGASVLVTLGSQNSGTVSILTGAGPGAGTILDGTLSVADSSNFAVVFFPANLAASQVPAIYALRTGSSTFNVSTSTALNNATIYVWNYLVQ